MPIQDSFKGYTRGIAKVKAPRITCGEVYPVLMANRLLEAIFEIRSTSGIPQYHLAGSMRYQRIVKSYGANGKGHTRWQALASGLMEMAERYSCLSFLSDPRRHIQASFADLSSNPFQVDLLEANSRSKEMFARPGRDIFENFRMRWSRGSTLTGGNVWLPICLIAYLLNGSNGMAAGNSLEEALLHGIAEVVERHCLARVAAEKIETPRIDPASIGGPLVERLFAKLSAAGQPIWIRDFSLGLEVPVVGIVRRVRPDKILVTAGVASSAREAAIRALTENSQTDAEKNYLEIDGREHYTRETPFLSLKDLHDFEHPNLRVELVTLERILARHDMRIYYVDATAPRLGIPSVYVYVANTCHLAKIMRSRNALMAMIRECLQTDRFDEAERHLAMGRTEDDRQAGLYLYLHGSLDLLRGAFHAAVGHLEEACAAGLDQQTRGHCLLKLGAAYLATAQHEAARSCFLSALSQDPSPRIEHLDFPERHPLWKRHGALSRAATYYNSLLKGATRY